MNDPRAYWAGINDLLCELHVCVALSWHPGANGGVRIRREGPRCAHIRRGGERGDGLRAMPLMSESSLRVSYLCNWLSVRR